MAEIADEIKEIRHYLNKLSDKGDWHYDPDTQEVWIKGDKDNPRGCCVAQTYDYDDGTFIANAPGLMKVLLRHFLKMKEELLNTKEELLKHQTEDIKNDIKKEVVQKAGGSYEIIKDKMFCNGVRGTP